MANTQTRTSELLKLSISSITKKCHKLKLSTEGGKMDMIERIVTKSNQNEIESLRNELISKRNDMEKIAKVLNGELSNIALNDLLNVYIKQSLQNNITKEWITIIEKFKQINDNIQNGSKLKLKDNASYDINEETDNLLAEFDNDELNEMKETLNSNTTTNNQITKLKTENEKYFNIIRTKDEIITNANDQIKRLQKDLLAIKEEEEKKEVQMDPIKRRRAKELLQKRVQYEQENGLQVATDSDANKKTISEMLNDATEEKAKDVINSMGVLKFEYDKTLKKDQYTLNMTNNTTIRRLTNDQRKQFIFLLGHCLVNKDNSAHIEKVKITNIGIDDKLFPSFIDILIENVENFFTKEVWMESNKIGNDGILKLAQLIALNPKTLGVIKLYNNKAIVSSKTINILLTAMEQNTNIVKFTFEWRLQQHRDRIAKVLRANQDRKRKEKWAKKVKK